MKTNFKRSLGIFAVLTGLAIGASAAPLFQQGDRDHTQQQDYSKNKTYQQGMREGQADQTRNLDHSKKRHFKKDNDQKAYEAGYQQGHQDHRN